MTKIITLIVIALGLTGCNSDYEAGVKANADVYKLYNDLGLAQQAGIAACFQFSKDPGYCAVLAASTNATQTLGGRPDPIRVAKSTGEIVESVFTVGLDKAVYIYGAKAVASAFKASQASTQAATAANAETAAQGIEAASKPPLVVDKPVIVQVPLGSSVVPTE